MVADTVHTTPLTIKSQAARRGPAPLDLLVAPGAPEHGGVPFEIHLQVCCQSSEFSDA